MKAFMKDLFKKANKSYLLLPILSGIFIGTSYIPFYPWAIFFCFVPLWLTWLRQNSWRQIWWSGWVCQFTFTLIGFNWVAYTVHEFGHLPWPLAYLTLLLYCSFANLHIPLAGILWWWSRSKIHPSVNWLLLPAWVALAEYTFPMIFDWHFGYTWLWLGWPAFQVAEWTGFHFLSTLTLFLNLLSLRAWQHRHQLLPALKPLAQLALSLLLLNGLGWYLQKRLPPPTEQANVLIVQANIGNLEKQQAEHGTGFKEYIIGKHFDLTRQGLQSIDQPVDFAIWPETAFPDLLGPSFMDSGYAYRLRQFLNEESISLVTGAYGYDAENKGYTNSLFSLDSSGELTHPGYAKTVLLAFGEYIPGANWFPKLKDWLPAVGDFVRGEGPKTHALNHIQLGPQICYEGLFAWLTRDLANQGTEIIVNVTNDSWYGTWQEPYQHLYMTLARAIEVRRPLVRSTNTGISTVILANGQILAQSPLQKEWFHLYEVPYNKNIYDTFFQGWGYWILPIFLGLWMIGVGILSGRQYQHGKKRP